MVHRVQLLVCHEVIGINPRDRFDRGQWCNLKAFAWCYSCDMYVCDIHTATRHAGEGHDAKVEFPHNVMRVVIDQERRPE